MREFAFAIEYDEGADEVMDAFAAHPDARAWSIVPGLAGGELWTVEQVVGPEAAVETLRPLFADESRDREAVGTRPCGDDRYREVLEADRRRFVVFSHVPEIDRCATVPGLAVRYLGSGLVLDRRVRGLVEEWRVLVPDDEKIGLLYDTLGAALREGLSFRFEHLRDAEGWSGGPYGSVSLPSEQLATVEAAVEHGYYETPRGITLDELSAELDVPRSTLSYRLRQAEARMAKDLVDRSVPG